MNTVLGKVREAVQSQRRLTPRQQAALEFLEEILNDQNEHADVKTAAAHLYLEATLEPLSRNVDMEILLGGSMVH